MEKNRWSLILMAPCLALSLTSSPVEAQELCEDLTGGPNPIVLNDSDRCDRDEDCFVKDNNPCRRSNEEALTLGQLLVDCDDNDETNACDDPSLPAGVPRIAVVANHFGGGGAAQYITEEALGGSRTGIKVKKFNNSTAEDLRARFDVLHIRWNSPPSLRVSWGKLLDFMNAVPDPCGGVGNPPCIGGGILFEDPNNVEDIDGLNLLDVNLHVVGGPAIVDFERVPVPLELIAFRPIPPVGGNSTGWFRSGNNTDCADGAHGVTGTTRGVGYGCLVNNHITFEDDPGLGLEPFVYLVADGPVVGVYGFGTSLPDALPGRILITGPDHGFHASGPGEFQVNHFCLLTNEIIWLSQVEPTVAEDAVVNCVTNAGLYLG